MCMRPESELEPPHPLDDLVDSLQQALEYAVLHRAGFANVPFNPNCSRLLNVTHELVKLDARPVRPVKLDN